MIGGCSVHFLPLSSMACVPFLRSIYRRHGMSNQNFLHKISRYFGATVEKRILDQWDMPQHTCGHGDPRFTGLESNMSWETKMKVTYKISTTLARINNTGIILRDFKSENLLLDKNLMPNIIDFGAAARGGILEPWNTPQFTHGYSDPQYLNLESNISWEIRMKTAYKISTTLAKINNTGIILRDFKSENLLLDKNSMPNIADFGAAARGGIPEPWNTPQFTHGYSDPQYLNLESNMSWETRMKVAYKISTTLARINNTGIILRDFKSENLLLDKNLMSNIADFGVAARGRIPEPWNTPQFTHGYGDPQYLNLESNMSWETRMKVAYKISTTLARINNTGIIFRDFKSENLLLDKNLMPNIADFGATARGRIREPWNTPQFTHGYSGDPQYLNLESNMSWETRMKVAYKISTTLARINNTGIILRDFKSENLLLDKNLIPNITDFGAAARGRIPESCNTSQFTHGYSDPQYLNLGDIMRRRDDMLVCNSSFHRQRPVRLLQHSSLRPVQLHSILSPVLLHHQHSTILLFISQMMRYTCRIYIIFHIILFLFYFIYIYDIVTFIYFLQTDLEEYVPDADPQ
ncbi:uncharacterized protein [Elaeis guineensis]|uniref:uncharacterized protein isoform X2 n=1 Tax=Elaeis guineensis var. tenera TaxID=51953 RepID=UPI003C6D5236